MPTTCPDCRGVIPQEDVNVGKDTAFCRKCDKAFALSDLAHNIAVPGVLDLASPPPGAWYRDEGSEVRVGAVARSGRSMFFVLFAAFWNSIVSVFLVIAVTNAVHPGAIPAKNGHDAPTWFLFVFLIPFVLVGTIMGALAIFGLFGRVEVTLRGDEGLVFSGVGSIGRRQRFSAAAVTGVSIKPASWQSNGQQQFLVCLDGSAPVKFGSLLSDERRGFLAAALKKVLV